MLTIYKASAGSGKTFTLAFEYIKILLGIKLADGRYVLNDARCTPSRQRTPNRHRAILAITFTNAATNEMKTRIVGEINKLANIADTPAGKETPYAAMLCKAFGCDRPALRDAAAIALKELLNDYGSFNVSTIDAFFQTVLRTFSREIDHQGDYELSLDREEAIRQSVSEMLDQLNYDTTATSRRLYNWIRDYMVDNMASGTDYNFFNRSGAILSNLTKTTDKALDEVYVQHATDLRRFTADTTKVDAYVGALKRLKKEMLDAISAAAVPAADFMRRLGWGKDMLAAGVWDRVEMLRRATPPFEKDPFDTKGVQALLECGTHLKSVVPATKIKANQLDTVDVEHLTSLVEAMYVQAYRPYTRYKIYTKLLESVVKLEFVTMVEHFMEEYLRESNTMLIADSGELLSRIISDAEMPFIYERLGMQLENLLIDEFQDTSRLQWHNLRPLVSNALADRHDNLIIGDVKQAIYRFRNSDPSLLDTVVPDQDYPDHIARGNIPEENTNYRSAPEIVRFNNTVFQRMAERYGLPAYGSVVQRVNPAFEEAGLTGYVTVTVFDNTGGERKEGTRLADETIYALLADRIREQHNAGYRWSDILILIRDHKTANKLVEYFLEKYPDIQLLSDDSLLLRNSPAVRTVMSMLALVEKVYSSGRDLQADGTRRFANHDDIIDFDNRYHIYLNQGLEPAQALDAALADSEGSGGSDLRRQVLEIRKENPASLVALIEGIIRHKLTDAEREAQKPYLSALQDRAIAHCMGSNPSISAFVADYNRHSHKWAILASGDIDAVQIMTVHRSKGLERDCVHIPFADWSLVTGHNLWLSMEGFTDVPADIRPPMARLSITPSDILTDPAAAPEFAAAANASLEAERLDTINLAYVAFTRAARELNIYATSGNLGGDLRDIFMQQGEDTASTSDLAAHTVHIPVEGTDFEGTVLTIGEPTVPEKRAPKAPSESAAPYDVVIRNDARELISVDDVFADTFDTGTEYRSEITDAPYGNAAMRAAARRGNDMHSILGAMTVRADLGDAVAAHLNRGFIRSSDADAYLRELSDAFDRAPAPVVAWFAPDCEVFAERSVYDPTTGTTYRPDRVVRLPDGSISVIDYKFTSALRASHRTQVAEYSRIIAEIDGTEADAYLWYPLLGKVVKL